MKSHGPRALGLLRHVLGHAQDAEDAWQETWLALWRSRGRLRRDADPWPFIRTVAVRKAVDLRRGRSAAALEHEPEAPTRVEEPGLARQLARLPLRERASLVLFFWEGLSVTEVASALEVPEGTVKTWMHRGRGRLRRWMQEKKEA